MEKRDFMMPGWMYGRGHVCKELLMELIKTRVTIGNNASPHWAMPSGHKEQNNVVVSKPKSVKNYPPRCVKARTRKERQEVEHGRES